jgi:hypothetical protein
VNAAEGCRKIGLDVVGIRREIFVAERRGWSDRGSDRRARGGNCR